MNALTTSNVGNYATIDPKIGEATPYISINHDMANSQANRVGASSTKKHATLSQSKGP